MRTPTRHLSRAAFTFLLCTAGWVAAAPVARAAPQEADPAAAAPGPSLDRRRLLTLDDGRVLRVRSRTVDGVWQVREGPEWTPLGVEVIRHQLLGDALAAAEKLGREVGRDDHARRAELARWMVDQGLYPEALIELSRVLRASPEHVAALRVVREARIPLELSDAAAGDPALALKETLIAGASGTPALTEVAVRRLAEFGDRIDLRQVLEAELRVPQHKRRAFAARALRRLYPGEQRGSLTRRVLLDGWSGVRVEAAHALRESDDLAVVLPALEALGHPHTSVRANAAEALGNLGFEAAVEPLMGHLLHHAGLAAGGGATGTRANLFAGLQTAYVMDFDVQIAQGASIADPMIGVQASGVVFDVRTAVSLTEVIELRRTMRSLRQLTGQDFHENPRRWADWWDENADQWRAVDRAKAFEARKLAAARVSEEG